MKRGVLCLLLLPACSYFFPAEEPDPEKYALTWYCVSPAGCERTEEVMRIDRATVTDYFYVHFASTQDESFGVDALQIVIDSPGDHCRRLHFLTLFGHELEPSQFCYTPAGFELEVSIPDPDPATSSAWVVAGRDRAIR